MASSHIPKLELIQSAKDVSSRAKYLIQESKALQEKLRNVVALIKDEQAKKKTFKLRHNHEEETQNLIERSAKLRADNMKLKSDMDDTSKKTKEFKNKN